MSENIDFRLFAEDIISKNPHSKKRKFNKGFEMKPHVRTKFHEWRKRAEDQVLGAMLENPSLVSQLPITEDDFVQPKNFYIYKILKMQLSQGIVPDVITVSDKLDQYLYKDGTENDPVFEDIFGVNEYGKIDFHSRIVELYKESLLGKPNLMYYVKNIAQCSRSEQAIFAVTAALDEFKTSYEPDAVRGKLIAELSRIGDESNTRTAIAMPQLMHMAVDRIESAVQAKRDGRTLGVPTGIRPLDEASGGLMKGEITVVGARPGMGKTALGLTIALNAARAGFRVGFVSLEMSAEELAVRLASMLSGIPAVKTRNGTLRDWECESLVNTVSHFNNLPFSVYDNGVSQMADIHMQTRSWMLTGGLDLLVVDYLQLIKSDKETQNKEDRHVELGSHARGLKAIARQNNIPVVVLSQLNRKSLERSDKRPVMSDLYESGEIEQVADAVWLLHRPGYHNYTLPSYDAEIIIGKNRHGPCEICLVGWQSETMTFETRVQFTPPPVDADGFERVGIH